MICLFVCLFVCPELIKELAGATDLTNTISPYIFVVNSPINTIRKLKLLNARKFYNARKTPEGRLRRTHSVRKPRSTSQRSGLYYIETQ